MNGTKTSVREYASTLMAGLQGNLTAIECVFCPPNGYLETASASLQGTLKLGAQNCHAKEKGAFTGESSASMIKELGAEYVILGHSERRAMGETDIEVKEKVDAVIHAGLTPIICIGETEAAYMQQQTQHVLAEQLKLLTSLKTGSYLIAYEPVWAIGTGKTPTNLEIETVHTYIKSVLGSSVCVLYGGSVNSTNAREILRIPGVSGALVGSASLTISVMQDIINAAHAA